MAGSSPSDLAVAFRSLDRRFAAAASDVEPDTVARSKRELAEVVRRAGLAVGAPADPAAVAVAIDARHADDWVEADLDLLRASALEAGGVLRRLEQQPKLSET